jgi:hypothetical protein
MKKCYKCKEKKPYSNFPKNAAQFDGYNGMCSKCKNAYARSEKGKAEKRAWWHRYEEKNGHKVKARHILAAALRRKEIERPKCCELGEVDKRYECNGAIQAHHKDYSKPLEVNWFCRKHHLLADRFVIN